MWIEIWVRIRIIFGLWIRICIPNADPDPNPNPHHWFYYCKFYLRSNMICLNNMKYKMNKETRVLEVPESGLVDSHILNTSLY